MNQHTFLAFDLGATSGRSVVGTLEDGKLNMRELTRFPNDILHKSNHYFWNVYQFFGDIGDGFAACAKEKIVPTSVGIDTWGVDFGLFDRYDRLVSTPYAYRDLQTNGMPEKFFELIPRREVYEATGIQVMNFNSLYQLFAIMQNTPALIEESKTLLFMPDMLSYALTKRKCVEFTIASTSQLLNPRTMAWEKKLFDAVGVPADIMPPIVMPGEVLGEVKEHFILLRGELLKAPPVQVVAVGSHDTASAVLAVPASDKNFAYLSSGTWSLMGIEVEEPIINDDSYSQNFTNEGGVGGTFRFLKNITGMWLLERCKAEWEQRDGKAYEYAELVSMAKAAQPFRFLVDPDAPDFANPESMAKAIVSYCTARGQAVPATDAEFVRCIFDSLAMKYRYTLDKLKKFAPHPIERLHVIGGGAKNALLNQLTANAIQLPVVAGPAEATAIGNIMVQAMAAGCVKSVDEVRAAVRGSVHLEVYEPQDSAAWDEAFGKFKVE
ncbi:MAG: rhamnulokinase [Prevotellaceae bacterium]|jgi:rhamnulokinase|nr:rhamnulokinase [Prevotellaceae bacterium]